MKGYFTVFEKQIPYYGVLMLAGFLLGGLTAGFRAKKYGLSKMEMVYAACFAGVGGIVGAKLLSILTSIHLIIQYQLTFMQVMQNGFVFYGGLLGGALGLFIYVKAFKCDFVKYFEIFAVSVPLGHALGRVGCFLSGCCYGIECDCAISFTYVQAYDPNTPLGVPLLPLQLIEGACLLVLYVALEVAFYKSKREGACLLGYLFAYPTVRFVLEFFRGDAIRGIWGGLSTSQWISLAIMLATVIALTVRERKKQK